MRSHARLDDAMRKQKLDQLKNQLNQLETISLDETVRSGRRITMLTQKKRLLEAEAVLRKLNSEYDSRRELKVMDSLRRDGGGGEGGGNKRERSREKFTTRGSERDEAISSPRTDLSVYKDEFGEQNGNKDWPSEMTIESARRDRRRMLERQESLDDERDINYHNSRGSITTECV